MLKLKIIISVCVFSILLGITSIIKTETRIVEKKIFKVDRKIIVAKKDLHETQLDYSYLSSPKYISMKVNNLGLTEYLPMDFSRIYLSYLDFNKAKKKLTILKKNNEIKKK
jgi:hypothetical protein